MAFGTFAVWAVTALTAGSTAMQIQQQRRSERAQRRQNELERRRAEIANVRERRRALAASRQQQSMVRATAAGLGAEGSAPHGGIASIRAQVGERIGFAGQQERFQTRIGQQAQRGATAQARGAVWGAIGALPGQMGLPNVFSPGQRFGPDLSS